MNKAEAEEAEEAIEFKSNGSKEEISNNANNNLIHTHKHKQTNSQR